MRGLKIHCKLQIFVRGVDGTISSLFVAENIPNFPHSLTGLCLQPYAIIQAQSI